MSLCWKHAVATCPHISIAAPAGARHVAYLREQLTRLWDRLETAGERPPQELSLAIVADEMMAALHEEFLQVPGTTDVLSFELERRDDASVAEGEVIICLDEATRQAAQRGHAVEEELLLYALHGLLHLCGYDDRTGPDHTRMHAREDELLESIGVGRRYAP